MPDMRLRALLDQNVPRVIVRWLRGVRPMWEVNHVTDVGLEGKSDQEIFDWAQQHSALVITFDEDFADRRMFPVGEHWGVVRLRVWPTTVEDTQAGLRRLLDSVADAQLVGSLVIVDNNRIRVRRKSPPL
ncbi:MAG: DUF5615 family PIN-like protein [Armatimonadetes bacterium]|nr:DUF5615 family PIN-like protein [Armatimonadota bacterium]